MSWKTLEKSGLELYIYNYVVMSFGRTTALFYLHLLHLSAAYMSVYLCRDSKLGERPTILDSHSDKVLKDFIDQKRDEKWRIVHQRRLLLISSLLMMLYTEISNQTFFSFLYIFSSRFWSIKSFQTL